MGCAGSKGSVESTSLQREKTSVHLAALFHLLFVMLFIEKKKKKELTEAIQKFDISARLVSVNFVSEDIFSIHWHNLFLNLCFSICRFINPCIAHLFQSLYILSFLNLLHRKPNKVSQTIFELLKPLHCNHVYCACLLICNPPGDIGLGPSKS